MLLTPCPPADASLLSMLFTEDFDKLSGITVISDDEDGALFAGLSFAGHSADFVVHPEVHNAPAPLQPASVPVVDIEAIKAMAFNAGREAAVAEAGAARAQDIARAVASLETSLATSARDARDISKRAAESVAGIVVGALAAVLPHACRAHGAAEVAALARAILPELAHAPHVHVRAAPQAASALRSVIDALDPELRERIALVSVEHMAAGDLRVSWEDGCAVRDAASIEQSVLQALSLLGVDAPGQAGGAGAPS